MSCLTDFFGKYAPKWPEELKNKSHERDDLYQRVCELDALIECCTDDLNDKARAAELEKERATVYSKYKVRDREWSIMLEALLFIHGFTPEDKQILWHKYMSRAVWNNEGKHWVFDGEPIYSEVQREFSYPPMKYSEIAHHNRTSNLVYMILQDKIAAQEKSAAHQAKALGMEYEKPEFPEWE